MRREGLTCFCQRNLFLIECPLLSRSVIIVSRCFNYLRQIQDNKRKIIKSQLWLHKLIIMLCMFRRNELYLYIRRFGIGVVGICLGDYLIGSYAAGVADD